MPLSAVGGADVATCSTSALAVGSDTITATYSGDATYGGSSGGLTQSVTGAGVVLSPPSTTTTTPSPAEPAAVSVGRVAGADRVATAVAASEQAHPASHSVSTVVLARSDAFADALAGVPLAVARNAPLLLTSPNNLDPRTRAEINRVLIPGGTIDVLGGPLAISDSTVAALTQAGYKVVRIAGADRYATAVAIANTLGDPSSVFEVTGTNYADALPAAAAAAHIGGAILLTDGATQAPATAAYLAAHPTETRWGVGKPAATADPKANPLMGPNRYATAVAVAQQFFPAPTAVSLAAGTNFPDGLVGAADPPDHPMLLVDPGGGDLGVLTAYLAANSHTITTLTIYGGTYSIPPGIATELTNSA